MNVTYNSPNRSHHYPYAQSLVSAGCLHTFISGYSRFGRESCPECLEGKLHRADYLQTLYVLSLRYRMPRAFSERLACWSKCRLDAVSYPYASESDVFLFYSGAGLHTLRKLKKNQASTLCVVEAVNTHARFQERILQEEHQRLGLQFKGFPRYELERRCLEYEEADAILCPSQAVKRSFIAEGIPEEKVWVVPYGFPASSHGRPSEEKAKIDGEFTVLYVGSLSVRKGIRYLIEGFQALDHPRKRLVLVGPRDKQSGFGDLSLSADIEVVGVLKGEELAARYRDADVFVQPSLEEGLSLVLGEALAHGLPIIATRESGVEELFQNVTCGYHVESRSSEDIRLNLARLAQNTERRDSFRESAHRQASTLGGWEQSGQNLVQALADMLQEFRSEFQKKLDRKL
ncbi:MAG TPA: hypothetical protein DCX06_03505 [Opitutae bacterium]|nr:hypothetical protein [Opitutae bacterium]